MRAVSGFAAKSASNHAFREHIWALGARPAIPTRKTEETVSCPSWIYTNRNQVERLWARLKEWRAVATGTVARLGGRLRSPLAGMDRWLSGTSVRSRNRACHYRRRTEPAAVLSDLAPLPLLAQHCYKTLPKFRHGCLRKAHLPYKVANKDVSGASADRTFPKSIRENFRG